MTDKKFSFVIPCFNAGEFIGQNINKLIKFLKNNNYNYEIILIDDGSSDNTFIKLKELQSKFKKIKILKNKKNYGKSFSIKQGLKKTKFINVVLIDCDLPYFNALNKVIKGLLEGNDFVLINRRNKYSKIVNKLDLYKVLRKIVGYILGKIFYLFLKLDISGSDTQAGLKAFKKIRNFDKHKFISNKFFLDVELINLYSVYNKKIKSIPVKFSYSKISSINIFDLKNFVIIFEAIKIIVYLKFLKL
jgi:glycosyltransferase involved in cell wall biosynthesis